MALPPFPPYQHSPGVGTMPAMPPPAPVRTPVPTVPSTPKPPAPPAGPKPLWAMSPSELQTMAMQQAQAYYQPILDELHRQQNWLQVRQRASQMGLQNLIAAVQGNARALGDETGRGLGDAFAQLAGQAGQEQYLTLGQQQDQAIQDLFGQINKVAGEIPGQAQQIFGDLQGQVLAHQKDVAAQQKAHQPVIRSVGGGLWGYDPTDPTKGGWIVPPPIPSGSTSPPKTFKGPDGAVYAWGQDAKGNWSASPITGPKPTTSAASKPPKTIKGPDGAINAWEQNSNGSWSLTPVTGPKPPKPPKPRFTAVQISRFKRDAADTAHDAWYGIADTKNQGQWILEPQHYQQAINDMVAHGIPLNIAQQALNRYWSRPGFDADINARKNGRAVWFKSGTGRPLQSFQARNPKVKGRVPNDPAAQGIVAEAQRWLGTPYSWGGGGPGGPSYGIGRGSKTKGFDCSGFIQYLYGKFGVRLPRTTYDQIKYGRAVSPAELQPGDVLFFGSWKNPHHVGMYIGGGRFIESPYTGGHIQISSLSRRKDLVVAKRML